MVAKTNGRVTKLSFPWRPRRSATYARDEPTLCSDLMARGRYLAPLLVLALLGAPGVTRQAAATETVVVDFETGPPLNMTPVTTEYLTSSFVQFIQQDPGFRPYRRNVGPSRANSGSHVVDVGADVCTMERDAQSCEFPGAGTQGRLSQTALSVTVFAGLFEPSGAGQVRARLVALRADGSEAASSPAVPVTAANFKAPITVSSAAGDIAAFALHAEGPGATGGSTLGFDDLTMTFPDDSLPDVTPTIEGGQLVVLQGGILDVAVKVLRLNGSEGPLQLSVSGLPSDVGATLLPSTLSGTEENATLRVSATNTAVPSFDTFTITADPNGIGSVAPTIRTVSSKLRVSTNFELEAGGTAPVSLGQCAPTEFPLRLPRSDAFDGVITLTAESLPPGVVADFVPSNTLGPGGALLYLPRLRLQREQVSIPFGATVLVRARSPGVPDRTLLVPIASESPTARLDGSFVGFAPMRERRGTEITLSGNGFCPETKVEVGNPDALVDTMVSADGRSLQFRIPRLATDGPVTVVPPGVAVAKYVTSDSLDVRTFRGYYGFQFSNFGWGSLSFAELSEAVGDDDLFARVNPCWPWYDCTILTPIPDPDALISWAVLKIVARASGGHCFGIMRAQQELIAGREDYDRFSQGTDHPFDLGGTSGPGSELRHYLDGRHVAQWTEEFSEEFLAREKNIASQVQRIRAELQAGRFPGLALFQGTVKFEGHVVTAYDVVEQPPDGFDIYVYDNNRPFSVNNETGNATNRDRHERREIGSEGVIYVRDGQWEFLMEDDTGGETWTGTGGTLWAIPFGALPENPTLITGAKLHTLAFSLGQFASTDGAARVTGVPDDAKWLPVLDNHALPMASGTLLAPESSPLSHTIRGTDNGTYSELVVGESFTGAVTRVRTGEGVRDRITADPGAGMLKFSGTRSRPLRMTVTTTSPSGASHTAVVRTTTAVRGRDRARLTRRGALVYEHHGRGTQFSIDFSSVSPGALVARAISTPIRIADGDSVTAVPRNWRRLSKVRLEVRRANGTRVVRMLRVRPVVAQVGIRIERPEFRPSSNGDEVVLRTMLSQIPGGSVAGVVIELRRGNRVLTSQAIAARGIRDGVRTDNWRLPNQLAPGAYRVVAHVTVTTGGDRPATLSVRRSTRIRVPFRSAEYVVQKGDTLWNIAKRQLPDGATGSEIADEWERWYEANMRVIGDDPDLILPGQVLISPEP